MITSIILTTYNRQTDCIKCLNILEKQRTKDIEILLLDDYHINDTVLEAYCKDMNIRYIHTGAQKQGKVFWRMPGFAFNIGAKLAQGSYYIIGGAEMLHMSSNCISLMIATPGACSPLVYDEPTIADINKYKSYVKLDNTLPFCYGLPAEIYHEIGGYDEDFTGYCFDDNDFTDRVQHHLPFSTVAADVVHLWNVRGVTNRGDARLTQASWEYNKNLYLSRKGLIKRNIGKDWGNF